MAGVTEQLADLALSIRFDNLPDLVIREAGRRLLDALGVTIAGADGQTTQQVRNTMLELGGCPEASMLGTENSTPCEKAAVVNATEVSFLNFMDRHPVP